MIKKLYPDGKPKAFNITYDDGVLQDIRFVQLLNKYGIKGTFNLNSQLMAEQFCWTHPSGVEVKRLAKDVALKLYQGHEIASHTLTHPYMHSMVEEEIMHQLGKDKANLENIFGAEIGGFALPFDYYSPLIAHCAICCGFEYARISDRSFSYTPPTDYFWWQCGVFHLDKEFNSYVENFFCSEEELALCQIVGHSYDLDTEDMWDKTEAVLAGIAADKDVISMTNLELVRYLKAVRAAEISENTITNNSNHTLWFDIDGKTVSVNPWESLKIK